MTSFIAPQFTEGLRELQLRCRRVRVPTPRWFAVDRGDVFDRDLTATRLGTFHLHLSRVAGLLADLLVRRRFVLDVQLRGSVRFEKEDLRFGRDAMIDLVHDRAAEGEPLEIRSLAIGVSQRENPFALRQTAIHQVWPYKVFLGQFRNLVMAVLEQ